MSNQFLVGDQMLTEEQMIADAQIMGISLEEYKKYYNVQSDTDSVEQIDPFLKNVKTPGPAEEAALVGPINQMQQNGGLALEDSSLESAQTADDLIPEVLYEGGTFSETTKYIPDGMGGMKPVSLNVFNSGQTPKNIQNEIISNYNNFLDTNIFNNTEKLQEITGADNLISILEENNQAIPNDLKKYINNITKEYNSERNLNGLPIIDDNAFYQQLFEDTTYNKSNSLKIQNRNFRDEFYIENTPELNRNIVTDSLDNSIKQSLDPRKIAWRDAQEKALKDPNYKNTPEYRAAKNKGLLLRKEGLFFDAEGMNISTKDQVKNPVDITTLYEEKLDMLAGLATDKEKLKNSFDDFLLSKAAYIEKGNEKGNYLIANQAIANLLEQKGYKSTSTAKGLLFQNVKYKDVAQFSNTLDKDSKLTKGGFGNLNAVLARKGNLLDAITPVSFQKDKNTPKGKVKMAPIGEGEQFAKELVRYSIEAYDYAAQEEAYKDYLYYNISPTAQDRGWATGKGIVDALEVSKQYLAKTPIAKLEVLEQGENILYNSGIQLSEKQAESFKATAFEEGSMMAGNFVPIMVELGLYKNVGNAILKGTKIGRRINKVMEAGVLPRYTKNGKTFHHSNVARRAAQNKQSIDAYAKVQGLTKITPNFVTKAQSLAAGAAIEETYTQTAGFETGSGVAFALGGRALGPFKYKSDFNFANTIINKHLIGGGVTFPILTEFAANVEAGIRDLEGVEDYQKFLRNNYGDLSQKSQTKLSEAIIGMLLPFGHFRKMDYKTTKGLYEAKTEMQQKLQDYILEGDLQNAYRMLDGMGAIEGQLTGLKSYQDYSTKENAEAAIKKQFRGVQKTIENAGKKPIDIEVQDGSQNMKSKADKANWIPGSNKILINREKVEPGVMPHEGTHAVWSKIFEGRPQFKTEIIEMLEGIANKIKGAGGKSLLEAIKEEKSITKDIYGEELFGYVSEYLAKPEFYTQLVSQNAFAELKSKITNWSKERAGHTPKIRTEQDLINLLGRYNSNIKGGKSAAKQAEQFKNLIDTFTEPTKEAFASTEMSKAKIKPETKKDVFSKANEAFEQYKNETPEARGIMVGMEFKPIVESMLKKYQDLYGMDKPTFEDIVSDVMMNTSPGYNGIPSLVKAWSPEKGASLTSYIYGNLPKRILGIIQNKYQTLGRTQRLDVEKAGKLTSEEGLGTGFVDTSSPDAAVRIQRQKAETIMGFSDNVTKAGEKTAQKSLMGRIPDISADFIRSIELADGRSITFSRTGETAKINFEGKEIEIKARQDKDVVSYINEKLGKTSGKTVREPNYREYVQQTAKNDLFNVISAEAGKVTNAGKNPTPEYSTFVEKSFNLYKDYISQSSINKRFAEFADPVMDPKKGEQAREKTAQGNLIFKKKNITLTEWKSYFEGDGTIRIDGRRRSLIDAIAQEIGFDRVMEQLHKEGMEKAFKERQGELGNEVAENYLAIIGKQLDRLPQGVEPPLASKDLFAELKKDKKFASIELSDFQANLINISNNIRPSEEIYNALIKAGTGYLNKNLTADQIKMRDSAQKEVVIEQKKLIKELSGFEIKTQELNSIEAVSSQWKKYEKNLAENILPLIPIELISARKAKTGVVDYDLLSNSFGFNGTKGKSRQKFEKLAEGSIGTKVNTEIWGEFIELFKKAPDKFVSISQDTQISEMGKFREIQASTLTSQEKQAQFNKIAPELIKNNKLVVTYHNALLKTLDAAITKKYGNNPADRIKGVEEYSPIFLNNKQYGLRVASPFTIIKTDISSKALKDVANEHLKESVKYKAGFASLLIEGNITPEKIFKLNSGYESVLVENMGRRVADKYYGKTLPEGISPYIKLLPPEFTGNKIQKLNEYYHLPSKTTLGDYIVKNYISEQIEVAKNNYPNNTKIINALKGLQDVMLAESRKPIVEAPEAMASKDLSLELNRMIDRRYGIGTRRKISKAAAEQLGKGKGKFDVFIPPNAEDFAGMMYKLYGKGKQGNADIAFVKENLLDPFERAENAISSYRQRIGNEFKILNNEFKKINKTVDKEAVSKLDELGFTPDQAVRVWMWNKLKYDIPELNASERKKLVTAVNASPKLKSIAESIMGITQTKKAYPEPGKDWYAGNIKTDLLEFTNKEVRSKFLEPWQKNVDVIFSKENLNKMQAALGKNYVDNLTKMLKRMQTGQSRPENISKEAQAMFDYINGSVGVTMFLNARSALLQTISSVNFINWNDNNVFAAGKTLANPKKFTKTFMELMNSDFLKQRRAGLQINVEEAEIAKALEVSKNKAKTLYHKLIKFGFKPTQIADSFAIAAGGTPFYINRIKTYIKAGFSEAEAKKKAFDDFRAIAEETQQSSRQDRVSNIQTGLTGRFVFAYNNTPFQMTRLQKKAALDLVNGRGDFKTNVSKILYYGAIQNAIFYSLQQALFATMFEEDETKKATDKRVERLANGMLDGFVRGTGLPGALAVTAKNTIIKYQQESERGYQADYGNVMGEALSISPPLSTKYKKGYGSFKTFKFAGTKKGKKEQEQYSPYDPLNPVNIARAKIVEATTNIPVARMLKKTDNLKTAVTGEGAQDWQRIALAFGWDKWSLGFYESLPKPKTKAEEIEMLKKMKPEDREQYLEEKAKSRSEAAAKSAATRAKNRRILDSLETSKYKPQKVKL
jgi:hypothetical protein